MSKLAKGTSVRPKWMASLAIAGMVAGIAAMAAPATAALTVQVTGTGAPDTPGGPYSRLSLAVAYVNANSSPPNVINIMTEDLFPNNTTIDLGRDEISQMQILVPMTINGDGDNDSLPCILLCDTRAAASTTPTGAGMAGDPDIGQTNRHVIEIEADGDVTINDLWFAPAATPGGSGTTVGVLGLYNPPTGPSNYTFNNVRAGSAGTATPFAYTDADASSGTFTSNRRWMFIDNDRGIFDILPGSGGGIYNATFNNCRATGSRGNAVQVGNTGVGSTTVFNGGLYAHNGQDIFSVNNGAVGVTFKGTANNRLRINTAAMGGTFASGDCIEINGTAQIDLIEYVDIVQDRGVTNEGDGIAFEATNGSTVTAIRNTRVSVTGSGTSVAMSVGDNVTLTEVSDSTFRANNTGTGANSVVLFRDTFTGTAAFQRSIFTGNTVAGVPAKSFNPGNGGGSITLDYCVLPTDLRAAESLTTPAIIAGALIPTETNTRTDSPFYFSTTYSPANATNSNFLAVSNARAFAGPAPVGLAGAGPSGSNLSGGGRFLLGLDTGSTLGAGQTVTIAGATINTTAATLPFVLDVQQIAGDANTLVGSGLPAVRDTTKYWNIAQLTGTPPTVDLTLTYPDSAFATPDGRIYRYTGSNWVIAPTFGSVNAAGDPNIVTHTGVNNFGNFAVAQFTCTYSLGATDTLIPSAGAANQLVAVVSDTGCAWTATSTVGWITFDVAAGTGSGNIQFDVAPNAGLPRFGFINVTGGGVYKVLQTGAISGIVRVDGPGDGDFPVGDGTNEFDSIADALRASNGVDGNADTIVIDTAKLAAEPGILVNGTANAAAGAAGFPVFTDDVTINGEYTAGQRAHIALASAVGGTAAGGFSYTTPRFAIELASGQEVNVNNVIVTPAYVGASNVTVPGIVVDEGLDATALGTGTGASFNNVLVTAADSSNNPVTNLGAATPGNSTTFGGGSLLGSGISFDSNDATVANNFVHTLNNVTLAHGRNGASARGLFIGADAGTGTGTININNSAFTRQGDASSSGVYIDTAENTTINMTNSTVSSNADTGLEGIWQGTSGNRQFINILEGCQFFSHARRGIGMNTTGATASGSNRLTIDGTSANPVIVRNNGNRGIRLETAGGGTSVANATQVALIDNLWVYDCSVYGLEFNEVDLQYPDRGTPGPSNDDGPAITNSVFATNGGNLGTGITDAGNVRIADTNTVDGGLQFSNVTLHDPRDNSAGVSGLNFSANAAALTFATFNFTNSILSGTTNTVGDIGLDLRAGTSLTVNLTNTAVVSDGVTVTYNLDGGLLLDTAGGNTINELPAAPSFALSPDYVSVDPTNSGFLRVNNVAYCTAGTGGGVLAGGRPTAAGLCGPAFADGDANGDGSINAADVTAIFNFAAGISGAPTGDGDVNEDTLVNATDANIIIQFLVNGTPIP